MSIDIIRQMGDDALNNQGQIVFEPLPFFSSMDSLQFRITDFPIPDFTVGSYTVRYKTQQITKPNGSMDSGNTFTFNFRVDKYWSIYQDLMTWKQIVANDETGAMAEDYGALTGESAIRTNFSVQTIDSNGLITSGGWRFTNAWIQTLGGFSLDQTAEGEPIVIPVTLEYEKCLPGDDA